ncbi:preprotein translocase subunit YajC [Chitiniphilus shinanonensis]|uniref:Sec translocon accessory complex subunit YajC n=1 Tax=Chitiniphilus shinanonensis TaxID=553088 RepID=A0ABQ6BR90_9NEIS|nr:preprotein translocase subunit YajC [Chitiniphilus shinanonensis]GLS04508.1 preprotein translocase subunit YajC [Chitiniphilus shinanonensis]
MFIAPAYAAAPAAAPSAVESLVSFLPMIAIFVLFWFLLIRPQQKRAKEQAAMLNALQKGDEVVTSGGVLGKISKAGDHYLTLEVAEGTEIVVQRSAVAQRLEKGTIKNNK